MFRNIFVMYTVIRGILYTFSTEQGHDLLGPGQGQAPRESVVLIPYTLESGER